LALSLFVLTQSPPHSVPLVQAHDPPEHTWPDGHDRPHDPQLALSVPVFTHAPPHSVPLMQAHMPPAQLWPDGHIRPHDPQLALSVPVFTHAPPHSVCPPGQVVVTHAPDTHD
jgi:hypothetical protein